MRRIGKLLVVATCAFAVTASAAVHAQPGPSFTSPEVSADRRITLRYRAPNAKSVVAAGELDGKPHPLTRGDDGVWSVTIGPLAPDIYTYAFNVDGVTALDPLNANTKYGYGRFGAVSVVQVPGDGPQFYDVKPVPHGEVRIRPVRLEDARRQPDRVGLHAARLRQGQQLSRPLSPPRRRRHRVGLDDDRAGEQHPRQRDRRGQGEADGRRDAARARDPELLDRRREAGARPSRARRWPERRSREIINSMMGGDGKGGLSPVTKDIVEDVMPMIESTYKVSKRPDDRAIAGLSMGGGHSINISFVRPELFRYVALMSPAAGGGVAKMYPRIAEKPDILNKQFKLFWVGVGKDDTLTGPGDKAFVEALTAIGIKHTFVLTEGRHEWTVWRHYLNDIAPLLFR